LKNTVVTILAFLSAFVCFAQGNSKVSSKIAKMGRAMSDFVPRGYDTLATATGDLNKDGKDDVVMVLKDKREDTADVSSDVMDNGRLLVILFKTTDGYVLAGKSGDVVMSKNSGGAFGDPFSGLDVKNEVLTINQYGGSSDRWSIITKFRYQNNGFYLIGLTNDSYSTLSECEVQTGAYTDINFVTRDRVVKTVKKDCKQSTKKDKINAKSLKKLENITDIWSIIK
jgi:hypothetical protein